MGSEGVLPSGGNEVLSLMAAMMILSPSLTALIAAAGSKQTMVCFDAKATRAENTVIPRPVHIVVQCGGAISRLTSVDAAKGKLCENDALLSRQWMTADMGGAGASRGLLVHIRLTPFPKRPSPGQRTPWRDGLSW